MQQDSLGVGGTDQVDVSDQLSLDFFMALREGRELSRRQRPLLRGSLDIIEEHEGGGLPGEACILSAEGPIGCLRGIGGGGGQKQHIFGAEIPTKQKR